MAAPPPTPSTLHQGEHDTPSTQATDLTRKGRLKIIFLMMASLGIIINLDGGAVPAALIQIEETFALNALELGLIGALVYLGIAMGSLTVGPMLRHISPRRATQVTLFLNTFATAMFGSAPGGSKVTLLTFRFFIGFLQAVPAVYFPVWVDEFGPDDARTSWMAVIQAGAPLGITIGYVLSGGLSSSSAVKECNDDWNVEAIAQNPDWDTCDYCGPQTCMWRVPFWLQSGVLSCYAILSLWLPRELYDVDANVPSSTGTAELPPPQAAPPLVTPDGLTAPPHSDDAADSSRFSAGSPQSAGSSSKGGAPRRVPASMRTGSLQSIMRPSMAGGGDELTPSDESGGRGAAYSIVDMFVDNMIKTNPNALAAAVSSKTNMSMDSPHRACANSCAASDHHSDGRDREVSFIGEALSGYPGGEVVGRARVVSAVDLFLPPPQVTIPSYPVGRRPHSIVSRRVMPFIPLHAAGDDDDGHSQGDKHRGDHLGRSADKRAVGAPEQSCLHEHDRRVRRAPRAQHAAAVSIAISIAVSMRVSTTS